MQLSFELPINYLKELGGYNDFHFCLAHLALRDPRYLAYYRESTKYKVCDNSAFELGSSVSASEILKAAGLLNAQEVASPDSFRDAPKTIEETDQFISYMKNSGDFGKYKVMGIVQGENVPTWVKCLKYMHDSDDIDVIGISYIGCEVFDSDLTQARIKAVRYALDQLKVRKTFHLLGIGDNPMEVGLHGDIPNLRSCDTSEPIVHGLASQKFDPDTGATKKKRSSNFFDTDITDEQMDCIKHNINLMQSWRTKCPILTST